MKVRQKFKNIETKLDQFNVRINEFYCEELALIFDLQSCLIIAKSIIISALERNEISGAYQRIDFPDLDPNCKYNCLVKNGG